MIQHVTLDAFTVRLLADSYAAWTPAGASALYEYLEELESNMDQPIEFDPVALRCDFSEYASLLEWARDYFTAWTADLDLDPADDPDTIDDAIRAYIRDHGALIEFPGGVIVSAF